VWKEGKGGKEGKEGKEGKKKKEERWRCKEKTKNKVGVSVCLSDLTSTFVFLF
jgi:hypothetical protein